MALTDHPAPITRPDSKCTVCALFRDLDPAEWATVEKWKTAGATWPDIARVVNAEYQTSFAPHTLSRHARGQCSGTR